MIAYPIMCLFLCRLVLQFIVILEQNQVLMENTKNILETFPEAVIIRGYDQDLMNVTELFVNELAKERIVSNENEPKFRVPNPDEVSFENIQNEDHNS